MANRAAEIGERSRSKGRGESPMDGYASAVSIHQIKAAPAQAEQPRTPDRNMEDSQLIAKRRADKKAAMLRVQAAENQAEEDRMDKVQNIAERSASKSKVPQSMMISAAQAKALEAGGSDGEVDDDFADDDDL